MASDANTGRRNALAIPGWILIVYSLAAIIYAEGIRAESDFCDDAGYVLINGLCYTVWKLVAPLLLIGIGLALGGALGFRSQPERLEQRLRPGTPTHVVLSILISFIVVPLMILLIQLYRQSVNDITYEVILLETAFEHVFLLELIILVALLMFVPFLAALIAESQRRKRFLEAAAAVIEEPEEPEVTDELLPHEDGFRHPDEAPEYEGDAEWPASRAEEDGVTDQAPVNPVYDRIAPSPPREPAYEEESLMPSPEPEPVPAPDPAMEEALMPMPEEGEAPYYGYKMPHMDVVDLEGIGEAYAKRLQSAGVSSTARLLMEDPAELAQRSAISASHIETWQRMAELTAVKGIGPQYAEALVRAGIGGIAELKRRSAATMAKQVNDYLAGLESHVLGTSITEARIRGWQEAAKGMRKVRQAPPAS